MVSAQPASNSSTASSSSLANASTDMAEYGRSPGCSGRKSPAVVAEHVERDVRALWWAKTALRPFTAANPGP